MTPIAEESINQHENTINYEKYARELSGMVNTVIQLNVENITNDQPEEIQQEAIEEIACKVIDFLEGTEENEYEGLFPVRRVQGVNERYEGDYLTCQKIVLKTQFYPYYGINEVYIDYYYEEEDGVNRAIPLLPVNLLERDILPGFENITDKMRRKILGAIVKEQRYRDLLEEYQDFQDELKEQILKRLFRWYEPNLVYEVEGRSLEDAVKDREKQIVNTYESQFPGDGEFKNIDSSIFASIKNLGEDETGVVVLVKDRARRFDELSKRGIDTEFEGYSPKDLYANTFFIPITLTKEEIRDIYGDSSAKEVFPLLKKVVESIESNPEYIRERFIKDFEGRVSLDIGHLVEAQKLGEEEIKVARDNIKSEHIFYLGSGELFACEFMNFRYSGYDGMGVHLAKLEVKIPKEKVSTLFPDERIKKITEDYFIVEIPLSTDRYDYYGAIRLYEEIINSRRQE